MHEDGFGFEEGFESKFDRVSQDMKEVFGLKVIVVSEDGLKAM